MTDKKPKSLKKKIIYSAVAVLCIVALVNTFIENRETEKMATKGGFESVQEFEAAKAKNIFTKAEYDAYVAQRDKADKDAAAQGGFLSVDEYKKAQYVDMPTKELYDRYLEQQAELRIAEEKRKAEEAEKARLAAIAEEKQKLLAVKGEKFAISISQIDKAKWILMDASVCSVVSEFALYQHKIGKIEYSENDIKVAEAIFEKGQRWYDTFTKNVGEGTFLHNSYIDKKISDIKTCETTGSAYHSCWDRCISPMKR